MADPKRINNFQFKFNIFYSIKYLYHVFFFVNSILLLYLRMRFLQFLDNSQKKGFYVL